MHAAFCRLDEYVNIGPWDHGTTGPRYVVRHQDVRVEDKEEKFCLRPSI